MTKRNALPPFSTSEWKRLASLESSAPTKNFFIGNEPIRIATQQAKLATRIPTTTGSLSSGRLSALPVGGKQAPASSTSLSLELPPSHALLGITQRLLPPDVTVTASSLLRMKVCSSTQQKVLTPKRTCGAPPAPLNGLTRVASLSPPPVPAKRYLLASNALRDTLRDHAIPTTPRVELADRLTNLHLESMNGGPRNSDRLGVKTSSIINGSSLASNVLKRQLPPHITPFRPEAFLPSLISGSDYSGGTSKAAPPLVPQPGQGLLRGVRLTDSAALSAGAAQGLANRLSHRGQTSPVSLWRPNTGLVPASTSNVGPQDVGAIKPSNNNTRIVESFLQQTEIEKTIAPDLLAAIVNAARRSPSAWVPNVWHRAWAALAYQRDVDAIIPPSAAFVMAIVTFARNQVDDSLVLVLRRAIAAMRRLELPSMPDVDGILLAELVSGARLAGRHSMPQVFESAWANRRRFPRVPRPPSRELVGLIINAAREFESAGDQAILNHARAALTFRALGGVDPGQLPVDGMIEAALLDCVLDAAAIAFPPSTPLENRTVTTELVDQIWNEALIWRASRWDLTWPPEPRPDKALLTLIAACGVLDPDRHLAATVILAFATLPLGRATLEQLDRLEFAAKNAEPPNPTGSNDRAGSVDPVTIVVVAGTVGIVAGLVCAIGVSVQADEDWGGKFCGWPPFKASAWFFRKVGGYLYDIGDAVVRAIEDIGESIGDFGESIDDLFTSSPLTDENPPPAPPPELPPELPIPEDPDDAMGGKPPGDDLPLTAKSPVTAYPTDVDRGMKPPKWLQPSVVRVPQGPLEPIRRPAPIMDRSPNQIANAWDDPDFMLSLCTRASPVMGKHGLGVTEMLMVMASESGLRPWAFNLGNDGLVDENTAIGLNQLTIANIRFYQPDLGATGTAQEIFDRYRTWTRAAQLGDSVRFFDAILRGLHIGNYSLVQRAAVVYYFNAGGTGYTAADFNQAAGVNAFRGDWLVYVDRRSPYDQTKADRANIGLTTWRQGPHTDAYWKRTARVELQDLYHAMDGASRSPLVKQVLAVLGCSP
jgi:hypothetical protein